MSSRTPDQKFANEFDADLYRLINRIGGRSDGRWSDVWQELIATRRKVRSMMHSADREGTEG